MREQPDLMCLHEPFMYDYYVHRAVSKMPHFDVDPDHPVSYADIRDKIMGLSEKTSVFFKDMGYYVYPRLLDDNPFLEKLTSIFLIRHPEASIASYYKLDSGLTNEEIGIEAQWKLYSGLRDAGANPVIVAAEDLQTNTNPIVQQVFDQIGLIFDSSTLNWENKKPTDWKQVETWHFDVLKSTSIRNDAPTAIERRAKFDQLASAEPKLQEMLEWHLPYYDLLMENRLALSSTQ